MAFDTVQPVQVRELAVRDAFEFTPRSFADSRGVFVAPFQEEAFIKATGHPLRLAQSNHSRSRRGSVRGLHFADVPPGQAKYVYCPTGSLLDVVVDIRVGSPTFGAWDATILDPDEFLAVYVPEGVAHAFVALEDDTVISYLCSAGYNPAAEHGIHPLDPALGLPWPTDITPVLSDKDAAAPTLAEARDAGMLPEYDDCVRHYESLKVRST
jgi:dTDP-4-dehydrorhamnose 3,5-epimerase